MLYKQYFPMRNIDIKPGTFFPNDTSHSKGMKIKYYFGRHPRHITWQATMKP